MPRPPARLRDDLARAALDLVENMLVVTDRDGVIVFVNQAFTRVTGYDAQEAVGKTPAILRSGVQDDDFYAAMWSQILDGRTWDGEVVNRRRDGTLYTDRMTITPMQDADGSVRNFVAVKRDVSSHAAALTAGSPSGAAHLDGTARLVFANPRLEVLLDRRYEDLLGEQWLTSVASQDHARLRECIGRATAAAGEQRVTVRLVSGLVVRVHMARLDVGADGPAGVVATFEDVTHEERTRHELLEREAYARAILDSMAAPTAVVDVDGVVRAVNQAWTASAVRGGMDHPGQVGPGADYLGVCRRSAAAGCAEAEAAGDALQAVLSGTADVRTVDYTCAEDGTWWELRVTPLRTDDGGAVLIHTDITARHELSEVLRQRAITDGLTGLHNRAGLAELAAPAFARARRSGVAPTVLFLDLDHFKPVNDEHGHEVGDHVLQVCARRLRETARETDVVARVGGDEFVVLCEGLVGSQGQDVAGRIRAAIGRPVELPDGGRVVVGASVGVAAAQASSSLEELLAEADARMYAAKSRKQGREPRPAR